MWSISAVKTRALAIVMGMECSNRRPQRRHFPLWKRYFSSSEKVDAISARLAERPSNQGADMVPPINLRILSRDPYVAIESCWHPCEIRTLRDRQRSRNTKPAATHQAGAGPRSCHGGGRPLSFSRDRVAPRPLR